MSNLKADWLDFADRLGLPEEVAARTWQLLESCYNQPARFYHNLDHIAFCLRELHAVDPQRQQPALELAIWFHDAVYVPGSPTNESDSARLVSDALAPHLSPGVLAAVQRLIRATTHLEPGTDDEERLIQDIDLAGLAKPLPLFRADSDAIRREYAHVPDAAFLAGRRAFLENLLERPAIYGTARFRDRCEAAARENLLQTVAEFRPSH